MNRPPPSRRENAGPPPAGAEASLARPRLLVADHRADARERLARALREECDVDVAQDAAEALRSISDVRPDLILSHAALPGVGGVGLLRAVRADPDTAEIPFLVMSERAADDRQFEEVEEGADEYLVIPCSPRELRTRIAVQLKLARLRRSAREEQQRHEQQLRLLTDSATVMIAHCDADARYRFVNRAYAERFGLRPTDVIGRRIPEVVGERAYAEFREYVERALAGEPVEFEVEIPYRTGGAQVMHCAYTPEREDDRVVGLVATIMNITERRRIEDEVRAARARIEATLDASEIGTWEIDVATATVHADHNIAAMVGFATDSPADGAPLSRYLAGVHPDDRQRVEAKIQGAVEAGERLSVECRFVRADGEVRSLVNRGRAERAADGSIARIRGATLDITAQRDAEARERAVLARAAEANAKFRAFFDQGVLFAGIMDLDGTLVEANRLSWEGCGYGREEVVGRPFWDGPWWKATGTATNRIHAASMRAAAGTPFRAELPFQVADGSQRLVDVSIVPIRGPEGDVLFLAATANDVTDRKRAESALRQKVEEMSTLLETLPIGVFIAHDPEGTSITGNAAAQELLRTSSTNLSLSAGPDERPSNFRIFSDGVELAPDELPVQRAAHGEQIRNMELENRFDDGTVVHSLISAAPLFDDDGRARGAIATALDITERRRAMEALRESDRRKSEFIATLAHELRNPLSPLQNGVELLRLAASDPALVERSRAMMERQLTQLVRLVDDLLDVSRISQGKLQLRSEPVLLSTVLSSAMETSRPLLDELQHDLAVDVPPEPIWVAGDLTRLAQVFMNLLNNAAKYSEPGTRIDLVARIEEGDAVVIVRDAGIGIAADQLDGIFDVFSQVDDAIERSRGGLGIGLSLVKRLVELHGGRIEAHSGGPGHGSEFVVRIPRLAAEPPPAAVPAATPESARARRRVLVVDDNRDGAETLTMILELAGFEIGLAHDGIDALDRVATFRPDAILLDIGLPGLNGYEVCRRVRANPENADMMIVAVTGWGQEGDRERSKAAGFDRHLVKPVDPAELLRLLTSPSSS